MAGGLAVVSEEWLGIVELGDVCARMRARNLALFATLGQWTITTPDGDVQRLYAEACHRHAWHAELWAARTPTIPGVAADADVPAIASDAAASHETYADAVDRMRRDLAGLRSRLDTTLDPGTSRTIELVDTDLSWLAARLDAAR